MRKSTRRSVKSKKSSNSSNANINTRRVKTKPNLNKVKMDIIRATQSPKFAMLYVQVSNCFTINPKNNYEIDLSKLENVLKKNTKSPGMSGGAFITGGNNINTNKDYSTGLIFIILCLVCFMYKCMSIKPDVKTLPARTSRAVGSGVANTAQKADVMLTDMALKLKDDAITTINRIKQIPNLLQGKPVTLTSQNDAALHGQRIVKQSFYHKGNKHTRTHTYFDN